MSRKIHPRNTREKFNEIPAVDSRGNPVITGQKYMLHYPDYFQIVMVIRSLPGKETRLWSNSRHRTAPVTICIKLWPIGNITGHGEVEYIAEALTPLDPVVLGLETRGLLELIEGFSRGCK